MASTGYELYHHGILGQKWGIRRYQNRDGSLTADGKERYRSDPEFRKKYATERITKGLNNYGALEEYNKATEVFNPKLQKVNEKYKDDIFDDTFSTPRGQEYVREVNALWKKSYEEVMQEDYGQYLKDAGIDFYLIMEHMPLYNMMDYYVKD